MRMDRSRRQSRINWFLPGVFFAVVFSVLNSCEVQKSVLARLRDLVIMSIAQVRTCLSQRYVIYSA
jgi:hypothetical protein